MSKDRELPHVDELVGYNFAVAGHEGTMTDTDNELFFKPATQHEVDFYNQARDEHPDFAAIMPPFYGVLKIAGPDVHAFANSLPAGASQLNGETKDEVTKILAGLQQGPATDKADAKPDAQPAVEDKDKWVPKNRVVTDIAIALDSASAGFKKPNILDAKLGVRLWADDAPKAKRTRFDEISAATTHRDYGFRIAGMQVYKGSEEEELNEEGFKIYDKDFGRLEVNNDNIVDALRKFIYNPAAGIDEELGRHVADAFLKDLKHVRKVLESHESRMYSASLLFVFEGDGEALRAAIDESNNTQPISAREGSMSSEQKTSEIADSEQSVPVVVGRPAAIKIVSMGGDDAELEACLGRSNTRVDSGIVLEECEELIDAEGELDLAEVEEFELSDDELELPPVYRLKLIDFAHADFTPGLGPDENCLKGVRSLIDIFEELSVSQEKE